MEESEKLTALKKAYAEIILNTTKEAAVRIMESERKAVKTQQELFSVKEESLRMLMRLKQVLDAKSNEAEIVSISQQKKIDELEAQLHEAEDIVKDLREELREVQAELYRVNTTQSEPEIREELVGVSSAKILSSDGTYNGSNGCSRDNSHKDYCYFPNPSFPSIIRRWKEPKLHRNGCSQRIRACEGNLCKELQKEMLEKEGDQVRDSMKPICTNGSKSVRMENSTAQFEVSRSIRRKRKRATRYSKGKASSLVGLQECIEETQNPSCSRNSLDVHETSEALGHSNGKASYLDPMMCAQEARSHLCSGNFQDEDKTFVQLDISSVEQSCNKDEGFVDSQSNKAIENHLHKDFADKTSHMKQQVRAEETQNPSGSNGFLGKDKAFMESEEGAIVEQSSDKRGNNEPEKAEAHDPEESEKLEGSLLNSDLKTSDHDDGVGNNEPEKVQAHGPEESEKLEGSLLNSDSKTFDHDDGSDNNEPERAQALCPEESEKLEGSLLNSDSKNLDHDDGVPCQSPDGKFLKYTFQRKRKREVSCSPDPNSCAEEKNAKKNLAEKCSDFLEPKSLSFTTESS